VQRLRLYDIKLSEFPSSLGFCQSDTRRIADAANTCNRRLLYCREAQDEGWWGSWAEMAFTLQKSNPYLTLPREVARLELVDVCNRPVRVNNQFFEYLEFGNGRLPKTCCHSGLFGEPWWPRNLQAYMRNNVPTFTDLSNIPQKIRVYATDPADYGKRILIQGADQNGNTIYSQDGVNQVTGEYVYFRAPFSTAVNQFSSITGIQKDLTSGSAQVFQVNPSSGAQVLLVTMEPSEMTASYRRYLFDPLCWQNLWTNCCPGSTATTVQATAICKLDFIPMQVDQDYSLIQNIEALIEEGQSWRLARVDNKNSKAMSVAAHVNAVRLLNGELTHYMGLDEPAVQFAPFGSARLAKQRIGLVI
jgi:hypothetical protein